MANVEHSALTGASLHEPKGIAAASANEILVADGAASGSWQKIHPFGGWRYSDTGTGTTYTTPTVYEIMDVVSSDSNLSEFTHNNLGRLTYTGTAARHLHAVCDLSYKHSTGSGQDVYFAIYKNGAQLTQSTLDVEAVGTADSANFQRMVLHFDDTATTNDYYEVYLKAASGNVIIHTAYLFIMGMPG